MFARSILMFFLACGKLQKLLTSFSAHTVFSNLIVSMYRPLLKMMDARKSFLPSMPCYTRCWQYAANLMEQGGARVCRTRARLHRTRARLHKACLLLMFQ